MKNIINEKILVCYLITKFDDENTLLTFLKNYKNFKSGYPHELLICFKLLNSEKMENFRKILVNVEHTEFIDKKDENDYDLGSYKRVASYYQSRHIFFLNSYSYPICENWSNMIIMNYEKNSLLATSASYESLLSSIKLKKFYKLISFLIKKFKYTQYFDPFPNPHIRTTGFLIKGSEYLEFMNNKTISSKIDVWRIESGKNSLTNHFKKLNFNIYVINSDGERFSEDKWKESQTYNYLEHNKSIISDKHIRKYHSMNKSEKLKFQSNSWGRG